MPPTRSVAAAGCCRPGRTALARHIQRRNGPDRDRRIAALERKLTIAA